MDLIFTKTKFPLINNIKTVNEAFEAVKDHVDIKYLYEGKINTPFGVRKATYLRIISPIKNMRDVCNDDDDNPLSQFDAAPFIDVDLDGSYISCKIGKRGGYYRTGSNIYGKENRKCCGFPKGTYIEFENDAKFESVINVLSLLYANGYIESVDPLRKVMFAALDKILLTPEGSVELVGEDHTIDKILSTITNKDTRLINRHILLYGSPGCGKSEIVKEIIKRTPDWIHFPLGSDPYEWEEFVKSLDKIMRFLGKSALIIADEIDENGLTRKVDREKVFKLLRILDGVGDIGNVKFIATTNRVNDLDEALLRVGRLGTAFEIKKPSRKKRKAIIKFYADRYDADIDVKLLTKKFKNLSGAMIRATFESCIIYNLPLTTEYILSAYKEIILKVV